MKAHLMDMNSWNRFTLCRFGKEADIPTLAEDQVCRRSEWVSRQHLFSYGVIYINQEHCKMQQIYRKFVAGVLNFEENAGMLESAGACTTLLPPRRPILPPTP